MKKIALYGVFSSVVLSMFRGSFPPEYELVTFNSADEYYKLRDVEYIINRSYDINDSFFQYAPILSLLQKWGTGYDRIDIKSAGERGVAVTICVGVNSTPVAEMTILLMLAVYRNLLPISSKIKEGLWAREEYAKKSYVINGKTVGLLGFGNIGQKVGMLVRNGFNAKVQYCDLSHIPSEHEIALGFKSVDLDTLLKTSDIVSLHLPLLDSTRNMIGREHFCKMKPSAILINTARGGIIDENELYEALEKKTIAGAGLDTFANEPLSPSSPLLQLDNLVATPHCGGNTADNDINMVACCVDNIMKYDRGEELHPPVLVNKTHLVHPTFRTHDLNFE